MILYVNPQSILEASLLFYKLLYTNYISFF